MLRAVRIAALGAVLALGTAAAVPAAEAPRTITVVIEGLGFGPPLEGVHVGDVVVWENHDIFRHTATARNGAFDLEIAPNGTAQTVIRQAGTIDYFCRFHPMMTGQIAVTE